jgi:hypothetical protein
MRGVLTRTTTLIVCVAVAAAGCATTESSRLAPVTAPPAESRAVLVEFVQKLPPGTLVLVGRTHGTSVRGHLMKATKDHLFVQPKTRLPEPIIEIPIDQIVSVTPQSTGGNHVGRAIGVGAAAGAGAALAVFLIVLAAFAD